MRCGTTTARSWRPRSSEHVSRYRNPDPGLGRALGSPSGSTWVDQAQWRHAALPGQLFVDSAGTAYAAPPGEPGDRLHLPLPWSTARPLRGNTICGRSSPATPLGRNRDSIPSPCQRVTAHMIEGARTTQPNRRLVFRCALEICFPVSCGSFSLQPALAPPSPPHPWPFSAGWATSPPAGRGPSPVARSSAWTCPPTKEVDWTSQPGGGGLCLHQGHRRGSSLQGRALCGELERLPGPPASLQGPPFASSYGSPGETQAQNFIETVPVTPSPPGGGHRFYGSYLDGAAALPPRPFGPLLEALEGHYGVKPIPLLRHPTAPCSSPPLRAGYRATPSGSSQSPEWPPAP